MMWRVEKYGLTYNQDPNHPSLCVILHKIPNCAKSQFLRLLEEAYLLSTYHMPPSTLGAWDKEEAK